MKMANIILESDSQLTVSAITDKMVAPEEISILVDDVNVLLRILRYCLFLLS